jgi:flagellar M-ring protein FliF
MGARIRQAIEQLLSQLTMLPPGRQVVVLVAGLGSIAMVLGMAWFLNRPVMKPLFSNLSPEDGGSIVEALRAEKVEFEISDGGRTILVPSNRVYDLRLSLASRGLPEGGGVGFEIFDKQTLGQTDFMQHLNHQRALQGELARTIGGIGGVDSARVHLAMPERSLFIGSERRASASVVVKLASGRTLSRAQVDGIVHLVSASVEGLTADAVTVVDAGGRLLSARSGAGGDALGATALEQQAALERQLAERVETMLLPVVGRDKAIARVAATLDTAMVERTEETYDPDKSAVRTQHNTREQSTGASPGGGGAPGVQANLTNEAPTTGGGGEGAKSERRDESQTYEISKIVSRTVGRPGAVKQLSVAVMVDGTYSGEGEQKTFTPRPQEELDRLKELVKSAVGFNEQRGDKIEIASVQFQVEELPPGEGIVSRGLAQAGAWVRWLLPLLIVVFGIRWFVKPAWQALTDKTGPLARLSGAEAANALTQQNLQLTQQNPERAARLVREWLLESGQLDDSQS